MIDGPRGGGTCYVRDILEPGREVKRRPAVLGTLGLLYQTDHVQLASFSQVENRDSSHSLEREDKYLGSLWQSNNRASVTSKLFMDAGVWSLIEEPPSQL
jgi:hypothetical protein